MKLSRNPKLNAGGFTLVELMIVVAVIGVLAAIAGVSYTKYIKSAKIGKLKQYAMEVANAQEMYKSQNAGYLDLSGTAYAEGNAKWEKLLGFSKKGLAAQNITVETVAGGTGTGAACTICEGANPSFSTIWYAVRVKQDFQASDGAATTIVLHSELESPMLFNEGK